jgi:histidyl-tRNA synthetase
VCAGGRYDNLAEYYTDRKLPGVGISLGLTRFFAVLKEINKLDGIDKTLSKVLVATVSTDCSAGIPIVTAIRNAGINAELYTEKKDIYKKNEYCKKRGIPFFVTVNEDGSLLIKDMGAREERQTDIGEIVALMGV